MTSSQDEKDIPWLERWRKQNFSWEGLSKHPSWARRETRSLQDYLRHLDRDISDGELEARGTLIKCGRRGLYHVLFIPEEWTSIKKPVCAPEELANKKRSYWEKLESNAGLNAGFLGTISGVHMPEDVEQRLVEGFRVSFAWVRFKSELRNIPKDIPRTFNQCVFVERLFLKGVAKQPPPGATLKFRDCHMDGPVDFESLSELENLSFDTCVFANFIDIVSSSLGKIRIDSCQLAGLRMTDTKIGGEMVLHCCSVTRSLEFANCKFSEQLLFLETSFDESIDLLSCDFLGRVTFADVFWPPLNQLTASASGSRFEATVTVSATEPPPVQLFQDAEFVSKVAFRGFSDQQKRRSFRQELKSTGCIEPTLVDPRRHAEAMESGSRTLRQIAAAAGDVHREQLWHRAEIIARRQRREASLAERGFSQLYGLVSDYGLSIGQPFVTLAVLIAIFAAIYGWLGGPAWVGPIIDVKSLEEGFGYSMNRTIPIGVFADESNAWRQQLLGSGGELAHIGIRALATCQSVVSAILIYLGIMAVRRKFRIS